MEFWSFCDSVVSDQEMLETLKAYEAKKRRRAEFSDGSDVEEDDPTPAPTVLSFEDTVKVLREEWENWRDYHSSTYCACPATEEDMEFMFEQYRKMREEEERVIKMEEELAKYKEEEEARKKKMEEEH